MPVSGRLSRESGVRSLPTRPQAQGGQQIARKKQPVLYVLDDHCDFGEPLVAGSFTALPISGHCVLHDDILDLGACALSDLIASREVSCLEVVSAYLGHIERTNPSYNAIVTLRDSEEILAEARAKDALLALLPIGLGERGAEFDKVFIDTFRLVVLRGQNPRAVLDREAETLNHLMSETGAPCWQPDPPNTGACQVQ